MIFTNLFSSFSFFRNLFPFCLFLLLRGIMRKSVKRILISSSIFVISSIFLMSSLLITKKRYIANNKDNKNQQEEYITINISGAIFFPGEYTIIKNSLISDILKIAKPKSGANLKNIDLNNKIEKNNYKLYIPYKKDAKIFITEIKNATDLVNLGIRKNISIKIFNFIKQHKFEVTWEEVSKINGVGEKTLSILKQRIIL